VKVKWLLPLAALLLAPARVAPQAKGWKGAATEECYCPAGAGSSGVPYGLPNSGPGHAPESAECKGLRVAYRMKDVDRKAKLTARPVPAYTDAARENRVEGVVRLLVVLCPSGAVSNVKVLKGLPDGLTETAIAAARKIKFEPAVKDGEKVAQFVLLEYNFGH
jgi:TonB family protein